jgi:hypothetical protein
MPRKAHSKAKLKNLSSETRAALWRMLTETNDQGVEPSYKNVAAQLDKEWDIKTSETALLEFYHWYPTTQILKQAATFAETLREEILKLPGIKLDDEQIAAIGQATFELAAIKSGDTKTFIALQHVALEKRGMKGRMQIEQEKIKQGERRLALQEKKAEAFDSVKKAVSEDGRLSPERLQDIERQLKLR